MLTKQQKLQAEQKLRTISAEAALEERLKDTIRSNSKILHEQIHSCEDPKIQLELIRHAANELAAQRIVYMEQTNEALEEAEDNFKKEKEKLNKERLFFMEDKERAEAAISEIKNTIAKIQTSISESVKEEEKKRQTIESDLEKSLDEIREKIATFERESVETEKENEVLREKVATIKAKIEGLQAEFEKKAEEKEEKVRQEKEELQEKLKVLQNEVNLATEVNKQYSELQKKNFDQKVSLYLRSKKFGEYSSSMESSAKTILGCQNELIGGVDRLNSANSTIAKQAHKWQQINNALLVQLKRQGEKEAKLKAVKEEKELVRSRILALQQQIKERKEATAAAVTP